MKLAISGDKAAFGALGKAYISYLEVDSTWSAPEILPAIELDEFDNPVGICGDLVVVGSRNRVHVFEKEADRTWIEAQQLFSNSGNTDDDFGHEVAIVGSDVFVGAKLDHYNGYATGKVYVFKRNIFDVWSLADKLVAYDGSDGDEFGISIALSRDVVVVGAKNSESAYLLDITGPGSVAATDGTEDSRIRITWNDSYTGETGFLIYRDGTTYDENVGQDVEFYNDTEAQRGVTYEYCVKVVLAEDTLNLGCDYGWRPPNGAITGRVTTRGGAGVEDILVSVDPLLTYALLFDRLAGSVRVRERETFNFDAMSHFTVEAWIRYTGSGGTSGADNSIISKSNLSISYPFELRTDGGNGDPGRIVFAVSDDMQTVSVESDSTDLNDNEWHHVACVHDADLKEMKLYVDQVFNGSVSSAGLGDITNDDYLYIGSGRSGPYNGQIDEVRIWNVARTDVQIRNAMNLRLTGDETGLVGYWPLDEGQGSAVTDFAGEAQYGVMGDGVYWTDNTAPLDIGAKTDIEGNYILNKLRFVDGDTVYVVPSGGQREFQPAFKAITLSAANPVENQVDFIEASSYTISGVVRFENTICDVPDVEIVLDGNVQSVTDKRGKYAVSASNGEHTLEVRFGTHTFQPPNVTLNVQGDVTANFVNTTKHEISGRVGGGCNRYVGDVSIVFESRNTCLAETLVVDSTYTIDLPPQKYLYSASVNQATIPPGLVQSDVISYFEALGQREIDLSTVADTTLDFIYRAPLKIAIRGLEPYITCGQIQLADSTSLPDSIPILTQLEPFVLTIEVNEVYGEGNVCPLDTGTVIIIDEFADAEDEPVEIPVKNGIALYPTVATTPSLVVGRQDEFLNNRSYQKALTVIALAEGKAPVDSTVWALVKGHVAPEGAEFVTFVSTPMPLYILRDPPGDASYAYLDEGYSSCAVIEYDMDEITLGGGFDLEMKWGLKKEIFIGFGAGVIETFEARYVLKNRMRMTWTTTKDQKTEVCLTTNERFSTSGDDLFIGETGDVFIGAGINVVFAEVGVIDVENCTVIRTTDVGMEPGGFQSEFAYTQQHIENTLIPELQAVSDWYASEGLTDSVEAYDDRIENWRHWLSKNDSLKTVAVTKENRSFSAGADFEFTHTSETVRSFKETKTFRLDNELQAGFTFELFGAQSVILFAFDAIWEDVYGLIDTTGTATTTVGYLLSDNDIGDNFSVDIKSDGHFPAPIFDVRGGVSSCPWEPWRDLDTHEASMVARDSAQILCALPNKYDVPLDDPAVFTLDLVNQSGSGETREYHLRLLSTSNPYGAIVKANGGLIQNGLSFFLDPQVAQEVTLTVERGPTRYYYEDLKVILYSPCEYANWENGGPLQKADTLSLDVSFDTPCSDVTLFAPRPGWTFCAIDDTLQLHLTDYVIQINPGTPEQDPDSVSYIGGEYRYLGDGAHGPGPWRNIFAGSLGANETFVYWVPPDTIVDGAYELRAYTDCDPGRVYSDAVPGTLDRTPPLVFGAPEPADEELAFGEEISVTFNEAIDCGSVDSTTVTLKYLDGPNAGTAVAARLDCDGRTIIIAPMESPDDLEGRRLEARAAGIRDRVGNPMPGEATWEFTYRKSRFAWSNTGVTSEVVFNSPGTIEAELVNGSVQSVDFTIGPLPTWMTVATPDAGTILPGEKQIVVFTIQPDIALGSYSGQVEAESGDPSHALAILDVNLEVQCGEVAWVVDPAVYEHTMTVVAQLYFGGAVSDDTNDRVAAYVGNELRGVTSVQYVPVPVDKHLAFLTVYSNRTWGEMVRFQVWDDDNCLLYNGTDKSFEFAANGQVGSPGSPELLTGSLVPGDSVLAIDVNAGWTWISTNISSDSMSVAVLLADLNPASGDLIKSQVEFSQFVDPTTGWAPRMVLNNNSGYMISLSEPGTILHTGIPFDALMPVVTGWNWISYLPQGPIDVTTALADLTTEAIASPDDIVKSQTAFAQYHMGSWFGSLQVMEPGSGYKLNLDDGGSGSFQYPAYVASPSPPPAVAAIGVDAEAEVAEGTPDWTVNPYAFQFNMTVTAVLRIDGSESSDRNDMIGAFVDDECRGTAKPVYVDGVQRYVVFLMVHSNETAGEVVTLRAFAADAGVIYDVSETLAYEADRVEGTVLQPIALNTGAAREEGDQGLPTVFSLAQNFPNPFNPTTTIRYDVPAGGGDVKLSVYDVGGRLVRTLVDGFEMAGRKEVAWQGLNNRGQQVATGVYFYRMVAPGFTETRKMVMMK